MREKYFTNQVAWGVALFAAVVLLVVAGGGRADDKKKEEARSDTATAGKTGDKQTLDKHPAKKDKGARPLKTSTVMKVVTKPHCDALKEIFKRGPKTSEDWDALIEHSEVLSEVSYILMEDGRCPDYVWEGAATQTLRNCAKAIIAASERRNVVVAQGAFEKLTEACTSCHDAHKEKTSLLKLVE